jgi:hypothetical protein
MLITKQLKVAAALDKVYQEREDEKLRRTYVNFPIGTKIISQSNEPSSLLVARVIGYKFVGKSALLEVVDEETGEIWVLMSKTSYWSEQRERALRKLNWAERYTVMAQYDEISEEERKRKESPEYQNRKRA